MYIQPFTYSHNVLKPLGFKKLFTKGFSLEALGVFLVAMFFNLRRCRPRSVVAKMVTIIIGI